MLYITNNILTFYNAMVYLQSSFKKEIDFFLQNRVIFFYSIKYTFYSFQVVLTSVFFPKFFVQNTAQIEKCLGTKIEKKPPKTYEHLIFFFWKQFFQGATFKNTYFSEINFAQNICRF